MEHKKPTETNNKIVHFLTVVSLFVGMAALSSSQIPLGLFMLVLGLILFAVSMHRHNEAEKEKEEKTIEEGYETTFTVENTSDSSCCIEYTPKREKEHAK